jgi:hypothetical protein
MKRLLLKTANIQRGVLGTEWGQNLLILAGHTLLTPQVLTSKYPQAMHNLSYLHILNTSLHYFDKNVYFC